MYGINSSSDNTDRTLPTRLMKEEWIGTPQTPNGPGASPHLLTVQRQACQASLDARRLLGRAGGSSTTGTVRPASTPRLILSTSLTLACRPSVSQLRPKRVCLLSMTFA